MNFERLTRPKISFNLSWEVTHPHTSDHQSYQLLFQRLVFQMQMNFGELCCEPYCKVRDYAPFKCSDCKKVFCTEHRNSHKCISREPRVIVCPICLNSIKYNGTLDPNEVLATHEYDEQCKKEDYSKNVAESNKKCPAPGCKSKLTTVNKFQCNACKTEVCMSHRFPESHNCKGFVGSSKGWFWN